MDTILLWFFLFLTLAIGWLLGFYSRPSVKVEEASSDSSPNIKHRLQLFFDSYDDASIDKFVQSLEVTPETVALHISIGKHFRTQGEVEKAILIHQNLMAHPELDQSASEPVIYELAKDYRAAGLYDRAEALLEQLKSSRAFSFKSLTLLLDIFEREKDWQNALDVASGMDLKRNPDIALSAAYYCCEIAEEKANSGEVYEARKMLKKALRLSKNCVRAHLELAKMEMESEGYRAAISHLKQVAENSPENLSLALPLLLECTQLTNTFDQYRKYLNRLYDSTAQVAVMLALVDSWLIEGNKEEAFSFLENELAKTPSMKVLGELLERKENALQETSPEVLEVIKVVISKAQKESEQFICSHCGFTGKQMHWMCPSCKQWQAIRPTVEYLK